MNSDEIKALIIKVLIMILSPLAAKYGIDGNVLASAASAVATLAVLAYGIYDHWNMRKVSENAKVVISPPDMGIATQR